jgi:ADP-ribose pyrophosphatase YjhB (NUDIX family)
VVSFRPAENPRTLSFRPLSKLKRPDEKVKFLFQARDILSHTYKSGFIPGIFVKTLEEIDPDITGEYDELAYALSESAYREMSEKIDLEWEIEFLSLAYDMAEEAHEGVVRDSGKPYISHPVAVAKIVLEEFPNPTTFKAIVALLHDVIEDASDPEAKKAEIRSRFVLAANAKFSQFAAVMGEEAAKEKVAFMVSFAESIVEGVEMLSKKRKEDYLHAWERPLVAFENAMEETVSMASSPFLWWSPLARPPKVWNQLMKARADGEYFARFEYALSNRLFISLLYDKLADRLHNLREPKPDKNDPSKPDSAALKKVLDETEDHYLSLAERLDARVFLLLREEVDHWREYLRLKETSRRVGESVTRVLKKK